MNPKLVANYATGVSAAKAKMVARVGQEEADRWERNSIRAAHVYASNYEQATKPRAR